MRLTQIAYEAKREPLPPLGTISELLAKENRWEYFGYIWEPGNRKTFGRSDIDDYLERDAAPIPDEADRDHYFPGRPVEYWVSGLTDYLKILEIRKQLGLSTSGLDYLDMGSSSGRVLRHFAAQDPTSRPIGCDLNAQTVLWITRHLPGVLAFQNTALPHLPLPDNSLDCVTAYSVFTHIDEFEETWLMELRRMLRPGGIALISNHGDGVWDRIDPDHFLYKRLLENQERNNFKVTPDAFDQPMPGVGRLAFYTGDGEANRIAMFRSDDYVRRFWGRILPVVSIERRGHIFHDFVVLQKPTS